MSKGQKGNKEAKKPKKAPAPHQPLVPAGASPALSAIAPARKR